MPSTANFRRLVAGSTGQRKSILRNLVSSLIIHESITTTLAKAKAVQPYAEKVITMGKKYSGRKDQRERATAYLYVHPHVTPLFIPPSTLPFQLYLLFFCVKLILGLENYDAKVIRHTGAEISYPSRRIYPDHETPPPFRRHGPPSNPRTRRRQARNAP